MPLLFVRSFVTGVALLPIGLFAQEFSAMRPLATSEANAARSLALGDLDNDGDTDIVIGADEHVSAYFNDGSGSFGPQVRLAGDHSAYEIRLVDVDQDGLVDVTWANWLDPILAWARNLGNGTFAAPVALTAHYAFSSNATSIDWADADEDGLPDLFTSTYGQGNYAWFRNLGNGVFGTRQALGSTGSAWTCAAADIDGDGSMDAVVGGASLLWIRSQNGDFSLVPPLNQNIGGTAGVRYMVAGNTDGDAAAEFFTAEPSVNKVSRFNYTSPTLPFDNYTLSTTSAGVQHLSLADLNGDGAQDLLASCKSANTVEVFYSCGPFITVVLQDVYGVVASEAADLDQDGMTDIVTISASSDEVAIHRQVAPGVFAPRVLLTPVGGGLTHVATTDLDGDGFQDVLLMYSGSRHLVWKRNLGDRTFGPLQFIDDDLTGVSKVLTSDQDGDGDVDLVVGVSGVGLYWYRNNGAGSFSPPLTISSTVGPVEEFELTDMDSDGDQDLFVYDASPTYDRAFISFANSGDGDMEPPVVHLTDVLNMRTFVLADLDQDADLDIVYLGPQDVMRCTNSGNWTFEAPVIIAATVYFQELYTTDVDLDGRIDLLAHFDGSPLNVLRGIGGGAVEAPTMIADGAFRAVSIADLDLDGDPDLLCGTGDSRVTWLRNNGTGLFSTAFITDPIHGRVDELDLGDLDGDGDLDILAGSSAGDAVGWYESFVGSHYGIDGDVYYDLDGNGIYGSGDAPFPFASMVCAPSASVPYSDASGHYRFLTDPGTYLVSVQNIPSFWVPVNQLAEQQVTLDAGLPIASGVDFGYVAAFDTLLVELSSTSSVVRCGERYPRWIDVANRGTVPAEITVHLYLNDQDSILFADPPTDLAVQGHITWSFQLPALASERIDLLCLSDGVFGDVLTDSIVVDAVATTATLHLTSASARQVVCSFDPNDKQVAPAGIGPAHAIAIDTDELVYTIRFQNTGNAAAYNVRLRDHLSTLLDPSRIRVLGSSHTISALYWNDIDGDLIVRFDDIMLPDSATDLLGSQGYVTFAIGVRGPVASGTEITNSVDIHFDINEPVITNAVLSTFIDCDLATAGIEQLENGYLQAIGEGGFSWFLDDEQIPGAQDATWYPMENGAYTVRITDVNGCSPISDPYVILTTGVGQEPASSFTVLPNPSTGTIRIYGTGPADSFEMIDIHGRVLHTFRAGSSDVTEVDLGGYSPGLYLLRWSGSEGAIRTARLVLE
ncbi:MAG TPA: T9SS type A sorting domain-containing protein [Flavobacteriales bacterium]|nr:T9SS type A sorting domain-containing protein [Flavobacteriales bacterium]